MYIIPIAWLFRNVRHVYVGDVSVRSRGGFAGDRGKNSLADLVGRSP